MKIDYINAAFSISYSNAKKLPQTNKPEIAFSGKSNVGKSSLINKIANRKSLARTSATPGKTRLVNYFNLGDVDFVDLPGYGYAKVSKGESESWRGLVLRYLHRENIALVVQLVDMRHAPSAQDVQMINWLIDTETPFIIALTKADKLKPKEREQRLAAFADEIPCFEDITVVQTSAEKGIGIEELKSIFEEVTECF